MEKKPDYLRRLAPQAYMGRAAVHWIFCVEQRRTGWLTPEAHTLWRECLLHTCARFHLLCPVYCMMPDHVHLLLLGQTESSDQRAAAAFLRRHTAGLFTGTEGRWQKQAYDHVLRKEERKRGAFRSVAHYITENPVRKGLVKEAKEWAYSGSMVTGHPNLEWRNEDYWERFWTKSAESA